MLIKDGKLDIEVFKQLFETLSWYKMPRNLGPNHREFFYLGNLEDDQRIIKIQIRPSKWMQVFESYKNRTLDGKVPPENYKGGTCEWGASVEVRVDDNLIDKVIELAVKKEDRNIQTVSW